MNMEAGAGVSVLGGADDVRGMVARSIPPPSNSRSAHRPPVTASLPVAARVRAGLLGGLAAAWVQCHVHGHYTLAQ